MRSQMRLHPTSHVRPLIRSHDDAVVPRHALAVRTYMTDPERRVPLRRASATAWRELNGAVQEQAATPSRLPRVAASRSRTPRRRRRPPDTLGGSRRNRSGRRGGHRGSRWTSATLRLAPRLAAGCDPLVLGGVGRHAPTARVASSEQCNIGRTPRTAGTGAWRAVAAALGATFGGEPQRAVGARTLGRVAHPPTGFYGALAPESELSLGHARVRHSRLAGYGSAWTASPLTSCRYARSSGRCDVAHELQRWWYSQSVTRCRSSDGARRPIIGSSLT